MLRRTPRFKARIGLALPYFLPDAGARARLMEALRARVKATVGAIYAVAAPHKGQREAAKARLRAALHRQIAANLEHKIGLLSIDGKPFPMSEKELLRTVIGYECFKLHTYIGSGVFPKKYFGYFDLKWDTKAHEKQMRETIAQAVKIINAHQKKRKDPLRLTDIAVAVTYISEGGTLLLAHPGAMKRRIHPVYGIGLDDVAIGFRKYAGLVKQLDAHFGSRLGQMIQWKPVTSSSRGLLKSGRKKGPQPHLRRWMDFRETILGTALMYLYEKDIASRKLKKKQGALLHELSLRRQFVITSLVYNSGLIFSKGRIDAILKFATGRYMERLSRRNAKLRRGPLPVLGPSSLLQHFLRRGSYASQPTTWSTVYHILQRFGGYEALRRFSDVFDAKGAFTKAPTSP